MKEFYHQLEELKFCVFDLETTGGNQEKDGIIEIGLIQIDNLQITNKANYLLKPDIKIPDFIQKLTSIRNEDVKDCPKIDEVIEEILEFMSDRILVAHNTSFDVPFFNSVLKRLGKKELSNNSMCTNLMSKYLIPNLLNTNLSYMSKLFKISHGHAHRALDDAIATAELFLIYLNIFKSRKVEKLNHLYYPKNKYEIDRFNYKKENAHLNQLLNTKFKNSPPSLLTLKGQKGVVELPLPMSKKTTINFLQKNIPQKYDWLNCTLQLYGSYFESFYNFLISMSKLKKDKQREILEVYYFLNDIDKKEIEENLTRSKESQKVQFIVAPHLVEDQLIIFNMNSISSRNFSAFRITSHRKKLTQFINSRINRQKKSNDNLCEEAKILLRYEVSRLTKETIYLCSPINLKVDGVRKFIDEIEDYSLEQSYPYNYPKEYIQY